MVAKSTRRSYHNYNLAKGHIWRIFEPFNRGTNTLEIKGTGLGLTIVKKAVEALDGKIFAKSKIGEGALFTIRLNLNR